MLVPALWLLDLLTADALKEALAVSVTVLQDKRRTVAYASSQVTEVCSPARHGARAEVSDACRGYGYRTASCGIG